MQQHFDRWTKGRTIRSVGTNAGAAELPFQNWRRFKEAFAPELIREAVEASRIPVNNCLDPFGGSGTTALACQFLDVEPVTVEVNPFLADLIQAKLTRYNADDLVRDFSNLMRRVKRNTLALDMVTFLSSAPPTFVEPGVKGRWIFDRAIAERIHLLLSEIERIPNSFHRRLFRVLLGGVLVDVSNVVVSGKGRRYRRGNRVRTSEEVDSAFRDTVCRAIAEIHEFGDRPMRRFTVLREDCRSVKHACGSFDLSVFSPPYPNSFDYTDVYNVELWTLGYLKDGQANQALRRSTISSHVQISRDYARPPRGSRTLNLTLRKLGSVRDNLWNRWIPEMVGAYFADMVTVLSTVRNALRSGGSIWMVVGDSRYGGVSIPTASILRELSSALALHSERVSPFRSMRTSAQQGGSEDLAETLLVFSRHD